jgi:hypothetical protein
MLDRYLCRYFCRGRCYDFSKNFDEKNGRKNGDLDPKYSCLGRKMIITSVFNKTPKILGRLILKIAEDRDHNVGFSKKRQFLRRKIAEIVENSDCSIDPRPIKFDQGDIFAGLLLYLFYKCP